MKTPKKCSCGKVLSVVYETREGRCDPYVYYACVSCDTAEEEGFLLASKGWVQVKKNTPPAFMTDWHESDIYGNPK